MTDLKQQQISKAEERKMALIQMYQAGFLDGINDKYKVKRRRWNNILKKKCIIAFETRFENVKKVVERGYKRYGKRKPRTKQRGSEQRASYC